MIHALNRTSASLGQLLDTADIENVDLILTSPSTLFQHLQEHQELAPLDDAPARSQSLVSEPIRATSVAVAVSGSGLLINRLTPPIKHLPAPADWDDLTLPIYRNALLTSGPSYLGTNHLMVEPLLQQRDWMKEWEALLTSVGNLVTVSSRSFGVTNKIKSGLGATGPVIDNYANLPSNDPHTSSTYFLRSTVSPTCVAIPRKSSYADAARRFIHYLLSPKGQCILTDINTGEHPVTSLVADNLRATQQQFLMNQPPLNYYLILKRRRLVQRLLDTAISFRSAQLKDAWRASHSTEACLKKPLPEIRALLTQMPVTAASNEDPVWLVQFDNESLAEQQMIEWQLWFLNSQRLAIKKLEELK